MNPGLLPCADDVVRRLLPVVLDAADMWDAASGLRGLAALSDRASIVAACGALQRIRVGPVPGAFWRKTVEDAALWCEAAVWAAARGDSRKFSEHVDRAHAAMRGGLLPGPLN